MTNKEKNNKINKIEEERNSHIGEKYNRLLIIGWHIGYKTPNSKKRAALYECICDCGNKTLSTLDSLKSEHKKSCGCFNDEIKKEFKEKKKINLTGKRVGKLTVLSPTTERSTSGSIIWECQCDCGALVKINSNCLSLELVQSCGCLISKGEFKISEILNQNNIKFKKQCRFDDLRGKQNHPYLFDFGLLDENGEVYAVIEFDGKQHFGYCEKGWNDIKNFNSNRENDIIKNNYCFKNNIPIIRIPYSHLEEIKLEDLNLESSSFIFKKGDEKEYVYKNTFNPNKKNKFNSN